MKKVDWNNENRLSLINRVDMYRSIENRLSTLVHDEEFMKSQEEITKDILEALKNIEADEVKFGLNTSLSATVLKPNSEEDFVCLIMPVQIR